MKAHAEKYPKNFTIHKISSTLLASSTLAASPQHQWFACTYLPFL